MFAQVNYYNLTLCYLAWRPLNLKAEVNIQNYFLILAIMRAFLYRTMLQPEQTLGELQVDDFKCYTLELGWNNNEVRKSCIIAKIRK